MTEKISLRIFWVAMLSCAVYVLFLIWFGEDLSDQYFKIAPTLFIIGLASFLIWLPLIVYRFLKRNE